jgi:hypothetical protein
MRSHTLQLRVLSIGLLLAAAASAGDGKWERLFDGKTLNGWRTPSGVTDPSVSWTVEDGCLKSRAPVLSRSDLWTTGRYRDYEFVFEYKVSRGGNTGIKYLIQEWANGLLRHDVTILWEEHKLLPPRQLVDPDDLVEHSFGLEFQLVDDAGSENVVRANQASGALYNLIAPARQASHPAGQWNQGRLIKRGHHIEHWLNGVRVLEFDLDSPVLLAAIEKVHDPDARRNLSSRKVEESAIALQHHKTEVWFRGMKVRRLAP